MTPLAWTLAAVCAALACGWWLTWREWRGRAQRLEAAVAASEADNERIIDAVDVLAKQVRCGVNIDLDAEAPFAVCVLGDNVAATLEAERDAHRATGAELRRVEGECAALRDRVVTRDGRGRFRKGVGE